MLSYTFSKREKALLVVLALLLVGIAWFMLIYQNTGAEVARLDGEIATARSATEVDQAQVAKMKQMQSDIERFEAEGARSVEVPAYDNLQPLMAELNAVLGAADAYSLTFDEVDFGGSPTYVKRGVSIDFSCGSYAAAKGILNALSEGAYPCLVDSVSIADNSQRGSARTSRSTGSAYAASAHVVFFEKTT